MSANKPNPNNCICVVDLNNQAVIIPLDIKYFGYRLENALSDSHALCLSDPSSRLLQPLYTMIIRFFEAKVHVPDPKGPSNAFCSNSRNT